jgi:antitoxin component YwqK of YwqJK toxin-antitoxin module
MEPRIVTSNKVAGRNGFEYYIGEETPFTGTVIDYHENGNKKLERFYQNGLRYGTERTWYDNGDKCSEVPWVDGKRHGHETVWLEANHSQKSCERGWKNGKYHGANIHFNHDGTVRYQCTYIDGKEQTPLRKLAKFFF